MVSLRLPQHVLSVLLYSSALLLATPAVAPAQDDGQMQAPAYIAVVDGAATFERDGQSQPAEVNVPLLPGDRLRTTTGRVEVVFPDGAVLDIDEYSVIDLQSLTRLRLMHGRARLAVPGAERPDMATRYQIDTPAASAHTDGPGEYRVTVVADASGTATQLATLSGSAALLTERGTMPVQAGELSMARGGEAPSMPQPFNSARYDAFDRWSAAQQDARTTDAGSDQYLPPDLQMYGATLEQNGSWEYDEPYGYVWYPRVSATWRPYYYGRWSAMRNYGWTWIGADRWSWPTHHYGRWGMRHNAWFWIPGRTWGPAWVSWAAAPGYVSWCPLGFDSRPLFALSFGALSPATGWVIVPRTVFGDTGYRIDRYAVSTRRFAHDTPFVEQAVPPVPAPRAAARRAVTMPGASAGVAVPRAPSAAAPAPRAALPRYPPTIRVDRAPAPRVTTQPPATATAPPAAFRAPLAAPRRAPEVVAPRWSTPSEPAPPRWAPPSTIARQPMAAPRAAPREPAPAARAPAPAPRENVMPPPRGAAAPAPRAAPSRPTPGNSAGAGQAKPRRPGGG